MLEKMIQPKLELLKIKSKNKELNNWELYSETLLRIATLYRKLALKFGKNHKLTRECEDILDKGLKFVEERLKIGDN